MRELVGEIWIPHKASFLFWEADPARGVGIAGVEPVVDGVGRGAPNNNDDFAM
jgi:hypothetical protein